MSICKWCKFYDTRSFMISDGVNVTLKDGWGRCKKHAPDARFENTLYVPIGEWPSVPENESCGDFWLRSQEQEGSVSLWRCNRCNLGMEQEVGQVEAVCPRCSGGMVLLEQEIYPRTRKTNGDDLND